MKARKSLVNAMIAAAAVLCGLAAAYAGPPRRVAEFDTMPKPVLLPDRTLAALFLDHEGPGLPATPAEQSVSARYSRDGGDTWSDPQPLLQLPSGEGGFGYFVPLVDHDGEIHLFILCDANTGAVRPRAPGNGASPAVEPLSRQRLDIWHVRSSDGREAWGEPRRIWEGRAGDLQSVTQLRDGRIVLPISIYADRSWSDRGDGADAFTYTGQFDTSALYSDDGGATWQESISVLRTPTPDLASYGAVEPVVLELMDGRVWMLLRTQMGRFYESFSSDRGASWSAVAPSSITSSDSPAGLLRMPDDRIVLLWNNAQRHPYAQGSRHVLHAAVSDDDGRTWRGSREVIRDPHRDEPPPPNGDHGVSYPFPAPTPEGDAVIYSMWVQTGTGRTLERFDLDWLTETAQRDDFTSGLGEWSVFGVRGVRATTHPGADDGHVLHLGPAPAGWPAAAVWNFPAGSAGELRMRAKLDADFTGALLLTDHFSPPFDAEDRFHSAFDLDIAAGGRLADGTSIPIDRWVDLAVRWDADETDARLLVDGVEIASLPKRRSAGGLCYLRLWNRSGGNLWIDHVEAEVAPEPFVMER